MKLSIHCAFIGFLLLLLGCTTSNPLYLNSAKSTDDTLYGYSPQEPIVFNKRRLKNINTIISDYIARLGTSNLESFHISSARQIPNPMREIPVIKEFNKNTGKKFRYGTGQFIEEYTIRVNDTSQVYKLYFNLNTNSRTLLVPCGLAFGYLSD